MSDVLKQLANLSPKKRALLMERLNQSMKNSKIFSEKILPQQQQRHIFPLSFAQRRLWFMNQLMPGDISYNVPTVLHLTGEVDTQALVQALNEILRRHAILRASIAEVDGEPQQIIASELQLPLPVCDIRALPEDVRDVEAQKCVKAVLQEPFDLAHGPLIRGLLVHVKEREYFFVIATHHIVYDAWSGGNFFYELTTLYEAYSLGTVPHLPALTIQYTDFALWQQQQLQGPEAEEHLRYWMHQLQGSIPTLDLPAKQHASVASRPAIMYYRAFPRKLSEALKTLSQQEGVTLFMILLAAFQTLLYRYTGQGDITVGVPVANRSRPELEKLIGFFINMLAIRINLSGNPHFRELLRQVHTVCLEAYAHQDLPFEKLVEVLNPDRVLDQMPLFQYMFSFDSVMERDLHLAGLEVQPVELHSGMGKFDLTMAIEEAAGNLRAKVEYNIDLFDVSTIDRMLGHFQVLLEGIVARPEQRLAELPLLTEAERHQLLEHWSTSLSHPVPALCLHTLFEKQVQRTPDAIALVAHDEHLSYAFLNTRANQLAHHLCLQGASTETLVGCCLERSQDMIMAILGILKAGGAYVPLDSSYPRERLAFMLEDAGVSLLVTTNRLKAQLPDYSGTIICLDGDAETISRQATEDPPQLALPDNLAYMIYTSGSTGQPKGVLSSHRGIHSLLRVQEQTLQVDWHSRILQFASFSFDASLFDVIMALLQGATLVLGTQETGDVLLSTLQEQAVTVATLPPAVLTALPSESLPILQVVISTGEACTADLVSRWSTGRRFFNGYGPTESTICATLGACFGTEERPPIGGPIAHTRFYVLDAFLQPVPIGVAGELFIGGVGLARGYLHCPDITAERFVPDLFSKVPGERLYRTGDLVRYREDGNLEFVGRVDNQIKLRGYRIELEEIEIVLKRHPQVRDAVVVMRHDARNEKWLVAYIVLRGENLALETLRSFLAQHLPAYMIPSAFVTLEQLPLTSHGKVDRQALPNPSNERPAMGAIYVAPQTLIEAQIAHVWEEILGVERVGIDDDFFVLGGHSLKAVQVVSRIHEQLAVRLSLRELFAHPTVRMLAQQVEHAEREALQTIPHVPAARAYALSPAQQRFWLINQLEAASTAYNIQLAIPIRGTINCEALETVLRQLIERHESLRTSFHFEQNNPVQVIGITPQHPLTIIDVRSLASEVTRQLGEKLSRDAMQVPFALDTPPLLRAVWLWTGAQEGILHITLHHIICDGWSLEMFEREFRACYQARVQGWSLSLPSLPIHYKDYATWQNAQLSSEAMLEHQRFWLEYLRPPFPSLILPGDYTHDRSEQRKGASYRFILQGEAYERLKAVAIEQQVSIFMIFVASLTAWLACLTGQRDVIVATPVAGREHAAVKHLFGLFLNTLILRNQVDTEDTFATLLQRVRTSTLEAMQHQAYPFERLLEVLGVERQLDHFPLTPVLINMLNFPREQLPHTPTGWTGLFDAGNDVKNDVNCYVREYQDGIDLICNYRVSLFKPATIVYLLEEYRLFLIEAVQSPHASLATLAPFRVERLTSQREQNDSLQSYEQYGGIYESYMQSGDLYTHFLRQAQIYRDKLAVVTAQRSYTYGQLEEHTLRIGSALLPCIAQKQYPVRVALLFAHSPQMIAAMLGVLGAGAAYVPLDAASPVRRLHTILRESRPVLLLTDTANLPLAQQLQGLYPLSCLDVDQLDSIQEYEWRGVQRHPEDLAYVLYTSGSTGIPKGVMQTHRNVFHFIAAYTQALHIQQADRLTLLSSYTFDGAVIDIFSALLNGCTLYPLWLLDLPHLGDVPRWLQKQRITIWHSTPSTYRALLTIEQDHPVSPLPDLRAVVLGGEVVQAGDVQQHLRRRKLIPLINLYGQSESSLSTYKVYNHDWQDERITIGHPVAETVVPVLTDEGKVASVYEQGELVIISPYLAPAYWNGEERPNERLSEVVLPDGRRGYLSGDIGMRLPDGELVYSGRKDFQVKIRGYRVETGEIEAALLESGLVQKAIVQGKQDATGEWQLVGYLVAKEHQRVSVAALHAALQTALPLYMIPSAFVWLDALPGTLGGKVDRQALPEPEQSQYQEIEAYIAPATPIEQKLARWWSELLGCGEHVSVEANFFALGGHSLLALRLVERIRTQFRVHMTLRTLFERPTIRALAMTITEMQFTSDVNSELERILNDLESD